MSLPSSMADFVPCDRLLQKAYYAGNVARFSEVFFKTSNALFASPKAGSDLVEKGELE